MQSDIADNANAVKSVEDEIARISKPWSDALPALQQEQKETSSTPQPPQFDDESGLMLDEEYPETAAELTIFQGMRQWERDVDQKSRELHALQEKGEQLRNMKQALETARANEEITSWVENCGSEPSVSVFPHFSPPGKLDRAKDAQSLPSHSFPACPEPDSPIINGRWETSEEDDAMFALSKKRRSST